GDGGDGARRAGRDQGRRPRRPRRDPGGEAVLDGDGGGDVPEAAGPGGGGGQRGDPAPGDRQGRRRAGDGGGEAGFGHAAQGVRVRGVHPVEGGGGPSHPVLQGVPAAVLVPDDGRDGGHRAGRGGGDGDAGGQHVVPGPADPADRDGGGAPVRDPGGGPDRRRRRRR